MDRKQAYQLIKLYVDGWKQHDVDKVLATLTTECVIIESYGASYYGKEHVKKWMDHWFVAQNSVNRWEVVSFSYENETATFEWDFECTVDNKIHEFFGISLVKFNEEKISQIHEYRMTGDPYIWEEKEVI